MAEHELNKIVDDGGEVFNLRDNTKQPTADRVTSWSSTTSDTKYPSEKLVKTSLDGKEDKSNKVSSWSSTTNNTRYPSEKLVKDYVDGKSWLKNTNNSGFQNYNAYYQCISAQTQDFSGIVKLYDVTEFFDGTIVNQHERSVFFGDVSLIRDEGVPRCKYARVCAMIGWNSEDSNIILQSDDDNAYPLLVKEDFDRLTPSSEIGAYVISNGTATLDTSVTRSRYFTVDCSSYSRMFINAGFYSPSSYGLSSIKAYIFVNDSNVVLGNADGTNFDGYVDVPSGATKLYLHTNKGYSQVSVGPVTNSPRYFLAMRYVAGWPAGTIEYFGRFYTRTTDSASYSARPLLLTYVQNLAPTGTIYIPSGYVVVKSAKYVTHSAVSDKLATARKLKTKLNSTTDVTFDGSADQVNIPVTGTLPVGNGGTGKTSVTANSYLKGNGTGALVERTYAEVRTDLGISAGANKVEASTTNGKIKIDGTDTTVYTHPTNGANTSKGDTTNQTPSFGHTFKALSANVDSQGHTTALAEHTVTIPNTVVTGGNSGEAGLMSPADKDKVDALGTASTKYVPTSGNASSSQVVMGNDSRLTDSRTPKSHTHGNIQNGGTLQTNDVAIANGDKMVITDARDSDKVARSSVTFDGSTTSKALTPKGTFETFLQSHQDISGKVSKTGDTMTGALTISNNSGTGVEVVHGNSNINTELRATRSDTGVSMWTGIGSGGERHGLYSYPASSGPNGDGWVTVTEANGLSSFKGKCDGYYGVYFGASSTLRAKKRLLLGYTNEQASQYERVHASAIIDVRMQSGSGSPGITMLLTISARGTSFFITRLHVLSHSGWDPSNFCPFLVNFNNNNKTAICLALATSKSSTTLKEFGYTDVKVLPINDCTGFSWEFAADDVEFNSSYMFMFKPYSCPASVIGTAVGDSNTPVNIDSSGNFSTVDTVKNSLKWNGYELVIGQAPTTPADNTIYIF
jgi:hypothetical protein